MMETVTPRIYLLPLVLTLAALTPAPSAAGIITFDAQPAGTMAGGTSFTEAGFTVFAFDFGHPGDVLTLVNIGAPHQNVAVDGNINIPDVFGTVFQITLTWGGLFNLNSVDIGNLASGFAGSATCGRAPRIEFSDNLGHCAAYDPGRGFSTVSPSGFQNISFLDVTIIGDAGALENFAVDNFNFSPSVTAAPEPSTLLLVFAGLAYVCCARRKLTGLRRWRSLRSIS